MSRKNTTCTSQTGILSILLSSARRTCQATDSSPMIECPLTLWSESGSRRIGSNSSPIFEGQSPVSRLSWAGLESY